MDTQSLILPLFSAPVNQFPPPRLWLLPPLPVVGVEDVSHPHLPLHCQTPRPIAIFSEVSYLLTALNLHPPKERKRERKKERKKKEKEGGKKEGEKE